MKRVTVAGKTVDEAVEKALALLETTRDRVEVRVLEEPRRLFGVLRIGQARVEVARLPDPREEAVAFLRRLLDVLGMDAEVVVEERGNRQLWISLRGDRSLGVLIGRRGQTLDALQHLVNVVANKAGAEPVRIVLDAGEYRERRRQTLERLAERLAARVVRTRRSVKLEPMPPGERKIIHTRLQGWRNVMTYSEGEEPHRYVVIAYKET